ncbi:TIGR03085 family metal-binding protein [Nocardioides sp. BP30]|uniref:TIGR03085 family metal-binding protein n=1 Tax=Nocardioides sp. BP30 TaxID=3036374 RepID=UPI002468F6A0|nr:TIGR03085 family metal-binding protein [Nocardioides sp. BP30]WGL53888.1 TIGR03085 family metal-binding protein [Nocardioides sp. BP30]
MTTTRAGSLARRERLDLCDLALAVGPAAPTLCAGWTVLDLVVHLLVRERRPWAAATTSVPALRGVMERTSAELRREPFPVLVERLRTPPLPLRVDALDAVVNTAELFVHHEDVRRAQPSWTSRELSSADASALWRQLSFAGRALVRPAGVPVEIVSGSRRTTLRRGEDPVVVSGPVGEVTLFIFGRSAVERLDFSGPADRVEALRRAKLGW